MLTFEQAAIVLPDANMPVSLRTILFSALGTSGQRQCPFLHSLADTDARCALRLHFDSTTFPALLDRPVIPRFPDLSLHLDPLPRR